MKFALVLVLTPVIIILLDLVWFSVAGNFFKGEIGSIARLSADGSWSVAYLPAILVYILMGVGLYFFVLPQVSSLGTAMLWGGLFGFVSYGIYDLTNMATLSDWTWRFAAVDMMWGTVLCATVTACLYYTLEALS